MTAAFRYTLIWIIGSVLILVAALSTLSGARLAGNYVPSSPDAFYHARRILDVLITGRGVSQFDSAIQVPEGRWIPWPWGFDTAVAEIVGGFGPFTDESAAAAVLFHVPVFAAPLAIALLVVLWRQLALSLTAAVLATLGFAALPLVFLAFAVGNVDHHFAELLWLLLALVAGISFFRAAANVVPAVVLGLVLGTAVGVHNGLFILQLPVVLMFAWRWLRSLPPPRRPSLVFAAVLVATTLLVSIPSEPWRRGVFEFQLLSWFHTYTAIATAGFVVLFANVRPSRANGLWLTLGAAVAAAPVLRSAALGAGFVSGDLDVLRGVTEAMSPYELYALLGPERSTQLFSWLMWLALPALFVNAYWAVRVREPGRQFFAVAAIPLLILMQLQYRFGVLGIVSLLGTLAIALDAAGERWPRRIPWVGALGLLVALTPTRDAWTRIRAPGGDPFYADVYPGLLALRDACERRPGVVLAGLNDGHWVRYHTRCAVIGNVFLLTEQDARKRVEVETLLTADPGHLRARRPTVDYVLIHRELELFVPILPDGSHGDGQLRWRAETLPSLVRALLGPEDSLPEGYRGLWSTYLPDGQVLARVLEIER